VDEALAGAEPARARGVRAQASRGRSIGEIGRTLGLGTKRLEARGVSRREETTSGAGPVRRPDLCGADLPPPPRLRWATVASAKVA
jgi:hypothetical protein